MIWQIALGIVLGGILLTVIPWIIVLVFAATSFVFEWINDLLRSSPAQPQVKSESVSLDLKQTSLPEPDVFSVKEWLYWLFNHSWEGRVGRLGYFKMRLAIIFAALIFAGLGYIFWSDNNVVNVAIIILAIPYFLTMLFRSITLDIQRLHDFDFSGWWAILLSIVYRIDFLGLIALAVMLFVPGTRGLNRFDVVYETKNSPAKKTPARARKPSSKKRS